MPPNGHEETKEELKTSYFISVEAGPGHTGVDLRVLKVWYVDGKAVRWESTEERWDYHPEGKGNWKEGDDMDGGVLDSGEKSQKGTGEPPPDPPPDPDPKTGEITGYFPIDENGYEAAKKWVGPQVTAVGKGKDQKVLPGNPHKYNIYKYNCGSFVLEFIKAANGPVLPPDVTGGNTGALPGNIQSWLKKRNCKHVWKVETKEWREKSGNAIWQSKMLVCEKCGLTKPYY